MTTSYSLTPILRPLGVCRVHPYRQCMRISSSTSKYIEGTYHPTIILNLYTNNLTAPPTSPPSSTASHPSSPSPSPSPTPKQPYHVSRTPSNQLPIYLLAKRGGNLHQTRIKKIEGDIAELRKQLQQELKVAEQEIKINQLTRHIVIKGWRKPEVAKFLEEKRF
ncbi:MAG: hypothetical protein M1830_001254 [Pleopsidium flavum]|nr:MAG: hypothetical protein M1830_001254 [Pleopsidium flavum]